jgi:UDP-xylose:glucoside alpha-1,3-xylosyltransferase
MDTDTIFFTSPLNVWEHFNKMDDMQMAAVAPEHEDFSTGWYNRFARHPYYGNLGSVLLLKVAARNFTDFRVYSF